ncbi:14593_t:CDS:2 [Funneliformis mosseae]|uniref:14593_t:CDS:1 n=1 Tax=Funneliformis mosseae TaxID=27381 RepID=A0A9N9G482_FUNMO|nr:14593_t:CDS:2 [Funneliformis mosseae]
MNSNQFEQTRYYEQCVVEQEYDLCPDCDRPKTYKCDAEKEGVTSPIKDDENFGIYVALKSLNDSSNIYQDFLNEWKNYLQFMYSVSNHNSSFMIIYGITQDPKTLNYMIVLKEMKVGNLRSNLMIEKYNPNDKYGNLFHIATADDLVQKFKLLIKTYPYSNQRVPVPEHEHHIQNHSCYTSRQFEYSEIK